MTHADKFGMMLLLLFLGGLSLGALGRVAIFTYDLITTKETTQIEYKEVTIPCCTGRGAAND